MLLGRPAIMEGFPRSAGVDFPGEGIAVTYDEDLDVENREISTSAGTITADSSPHASGAPHEVPGLWDSPLVFAATPLGNLADATQRLRALFATADIIAAEDTRRTRHLCSALGVRPQGKLVSFHAHNEDSRAEEILERIHRDGARTLVVSDAGMPGVSDPGFRLVEAAIRSQVSFTVAPGASAVTTALLLSGLPGEQFCFAGFYPRKVSHRRALHRRLDAEAWTSVLFESPHRIAATMAELSRELGDQRRAALCREMTKKHEQVIRGSLGEIAAVAAAETLRGEIVIVIGPAEQSTREVDMDDVVEHITARVAAGEKMKTVAKEAAEHYGLSSRELYDAAIRSKKSS